MATGTPFASLVSTNVRSVNLQTWMVEARDAEKWGARVEDTLNLERGSFKSLLSCAKQFG